MLIISLRGHLDAVCTPSGKDDAIHFKPRHSRKCWSRRWFHYRRISLSYVPGLLTSYAACALILLGSLPLSLAQQPGVQQPQGGMASAGPHQAEFDSQHRPVTAGGFVKTGPIVFQDV